MSGSDRGFEVDEAEVGGLEDIGDTAEERLPAIRAFTGGCGCGADRIVGYHVSCDSEVHPGQFVGVRHYGGRGLRKMKAPARREESSAKEDRNKDAEIGGNADPDASSCLLHCHESVGCGDPGHSSIQSTDQFCVLSGDENSIHAGE